MIASKILDLLKIRRVTRKELASRIGISESGLSQVLKTDDLKSSTLIKIAVALNVSVCYFFEEDKKFKPNENNYLDKTICENCISKDQIIESLKSQIENLNRIIELLDQKGG